MDLIYDWKGFQALFQVKKRNSMTESEADDTIYLVKDGSRVLAAFSDTFDTATWSGRTIDEILEESQNREIFAVEYEDVSQFFEGLGEVGGIEKGGSRKAKAVPAIPVDGWFGNHILDCVQNIRLRMNPKQLGQRKHRTQKTPFRGPFLLSVFQKRLRRFLPNQFGLYIQVSEAGAVQRSIVIFFLKGRIVSFHLPDLSAMIPERRKVATEVIKFLEAKYLMNIFGVFTTAGEWADWSETDRPWRFLASHLIPFPWFLRIIVRYQVAVER